MVGSLELAAALLLVGAGAAKLRAPAPAAAMLHRVWARWHAGPGLVRLIGLGEVGVGLWAIGGDRLADGALAAWYLACTAVAGYLARRAPATPCGCFGRADSPVGIAHVVQNAGCAAVAIAAAARPPGRFGGLLELGPLDAVVGGALVLLLAYVGFLSITALPALAAARRQLETP